MADSKPCKSVRTTFLYESMNKSNYTDKIIRLAISKGRKLAVKDLAFEVATIQKYYKFPMKKQVMDAFEEGLLKPIVFPPGIKEKVPTCLPFMLYASGAKIGAYVFIDNYKSYNKKDDTYSIDPKKLYCLLESAYMGIIIQKHFSAVSKATYLCSEGSDIFAHIFIRVLNRKYALNIDQRAYAKVLYLAAKFFLINVLGMNDDDVTNGYALKVAKGSTDIMMREVDMKFAEANAYESIYTFIEAIRENSHMLSQSLAELTTREFITDFVAMYHASSLFALEHLSYFMFLISSVVTGAYLHNQAVLEEIVGKSGAKLYTQLSVYAV